MGFLNGLKKIGSSISQGVKKFGKYAWDHREGIGKGLATAADIAGYFGVPYADKASKAIRTITDISKKVGDDKLSKGLESSLFKKDKSKSPDKDKSKSIDKTPLNNNQNPSSNGYSLNTRVSGGTKEGIRVNSWKH